MLKLSFFAGVDTSKLCLNRKSLGKTEGYNVYAGGTLVEQISRFIQQVQSYSKELQTQSIKATVPLRIYYISTVIETEKIDTLLIKPIFNLLEPELYIQSVCICKTVATEQELYYELINGNALLITPTNYYFFKAEKAINDTPVDSDIETTLQGPQSALSENITTNLNIIRHRYQSNGFQMERYELGTISKTTGYLIYDAELADPSILAKVKEKLSQIDVKMLQATGQLENILNGKKKSLFPTMILTNRPDRIVLNLSQGKMVILLEGTSFVLIIPSVFYDFMSSMDDLYLPYWVAKGLVALRYIALLLTISLPALYIAVVSFNPEFFRVQLALSIAGSRGAVPYPSYIEVIFMLFMTEALTEASIRLPKVIGGTATTVGGLILGQAAQQAGLVSSIMIIVTSAVAISNFVIPINTMSFAVRAIRYPLIFFASLFGLIGVIGGLFAFACYLTNLRSFDQPFLKLFVNEKNQSYK
ncbi:spore germination protein [Paenibacillus sp. ATY16]|nr:spore germination protein [Paenibacillus sp. ATY16]